MPGPNPDLARAIELLTPDGPPRVWSLIVTVFGDTLGPEGFEIGAGPLSRLLEPAGVTGQAMRVALHRLKRDGWIEARRDGRSGFYRLHPDRQMDVALASALVYAFGPTRSAGWYLRLTEPGQDGSAGIEVAPGLHLQFGMASQHDAPDHLDLVPSAKAPNWMRQRICSDADAEEFRQLFQALSRVEALIGPEPDVAGPEAMTLRFLIVHGWRRLILRHPGIPDELFPDGCPRAICRFCVGRLLTRLPRPSAAEIAAL